MLANQNANGNQQSGGRGNQPASPSTTQGRKQRTAGPLRADDPFFPQCKFDRIPYPGTRLVGRAQFAGRTGNYQQLFNQRGALGAIFQMRPLCNVVCLFVFRQALLQLNASHTTLPKPLLPHCTAAVETCNYSACPSNTSLPVFAG